MRVSLLYPRWNPCHPRHYILNTGICLTKSRFLSSCRDETFPLPVGNNGHLSISVTKPNNIQNGSSASSRVIIYLPPGPIFNAFNGNAESNHNEMDSGLGPDSISPIDYSLASSKTDSPQHALACMTSSIVVTVNYRLGPTHKGNYASSGAESEPVSDTVEFHKYPTPVHDTLAAFDWIQEHLQPTQLGVFGSHIGGSLALMLALTEAQSLCGIAALEPICDWPSLDDYCTSATDIQESSTRRSKRPVKRKGPAPLDLVPLLEAREKYFTSFERCFDAFASPILFLRSAGRDAQKTFPRYLTGPDYPVPVLEDTGKITESPAADAYLDAEIGSDGNSSESPVPVRRRKALSRWPPYGLDYELSSKTTTWSGPSHGIGRLQVTLPWVRIFLRNGSFNQESMNKEPLSNRTVLGHQGEEMVTVMRRACFWGREKGFGERRVTLGKVDENLGQEVKLYFEEVFDEANTDLSVSTLTS